MILGEKRGGKYERWRENFGGRKIFEKKSEEFGKDGEEVVEKKGRKMQRRRKRPVGGNGENEKTEKNGEKKMKKRKKEREKEKSKERRWRSMCILHPNREED